MKTNLYTICLVLAVNLFGMSAGFAETHGAAQENKAARASDSVWKEDKDGVEGEHEYRLVNPEGNLTRAKCPYTCADRGIAAEHCKEWKSKDGTECYVQDTRAPQGAVPLGGESAKH